MNIIIYNRDKRDSKSELLIKRILNTEPTFINQAMIDDIPEYDYIVYYIRGEDVIGIASAIEQAILREGKVIVLLSSKNFESFNSYERVKKVYAKILKKYDVKVFNNWRGLALYTNRRIAHGNNKS